MTLHPAVEELVEFAVTGEDIEVCNLSVRELPKMAGHTLEDLQLPAKASIMVLAVVKSNGRHHFDPSRSLRLGEEDELIIIAQPLAVDRLTEEFE